MSKIYYLTQIEDEFKLINKIERKNKIEKLKSKKISDILIYIEKKREQRWEASLLPKCGCIFYFIY